MSSELVTLAERYVLESPIATGGMATVWRARDDVLARPVAVKVLHPHLAEDEGFLQRFRREALAAARLTHPNIVAIYDTGHETSPDGEVRHFIVMEHCGEGTLADVLETEGPLDADGAAGIGCTMCEALAFAHKRGIVHRDVKPPNVLIAADGTLKVGDFGIAKAAFASGEPGGSNDITTTGAILGTVAYLSPEQVQGLEPDARSDIYSLGVVLYELVTGRPPFTDESQIAVAMKHVRSEPPRPRSIRAGIPRAFETVVMRALEKDPERRFPSAEEMRRALASMTSGTDTTAVFRPEIPTRTSIGGEEAPPPRSQSPARNLVPAMILVALAVALAVFLPRVLPTLFESEGGGPGGSARDSEGRGSPRPLEVSAVADFDPYGGGEEHSEEAELAADGDPATSWTTETYEAPLTAIGKPGVGLLFDLGTPRVVDRVRLSASAGAIQIRTSDEPAGDETGFENVARGPAAGPTVFELDGVTGRYWLLWITELPGAGGGEASIAEVDFLGP